ncbi:MAG: thioredoxin domain-containing protein [Caldilineaceae bacterium]|nr:thioredoxin domain-containing protein [Caldilineaceae bacterium]
MSEQKPTNRLIHETSPYLRQHAHNPVDWYPWGKEALTKARDEDKPIFLSIGYSACHWCHVMEAESFEDATIAAVMNELFVNIKVDREERPDLDAIYMDAVVSMTNSGGWPMSVFLTPTGQPFYGGTYYPPQARYGLPSFYQVLQSVSKAYRERRQDVLGQAERLTQSLQRTAYLSAQAGDIGTDLLDDAIGTLEEHFDRADGGFGSHPKFPQPMTLDFLMANYQRTRNLDTLYMAELTLEKMAQGGIYDQLGGGFHRYSVDDIWLVPHFEKMLYDNSQLLRTYLHAWQISGRPLYRQIVEETIDYVLREMTAPTGGFYSTQDADSEGEEGKFFVWRPSEIRAALDPQAAAIVESYYGVTERGNFEGHTILSVTRTTAEIATQFHMSENAVAQILATARQKLFAVRERRSKPVRDEKILTEWNGLMIHALAECGVTLGRNDALEAAQAAADFILRALSQADGKLYRSYKDGQARLNAYLEDYAAFIRALVSLYESTFELRWLGEASRLTQLMFAQFHDPINGGFFQTGTDHETLVIRRKDFIDNAIPSGNSMAAEALLRLGLLVGNGEYRQEAQRIMLVMRDTMARQPTGFGRLLGAVETILSPSQEIAIIGDADRAETQALLAAVRTRYLPHTVVASKRPGEASVLPLLAGRDMVNGAATAYVCENYSCQLPVTTAVALGKLIDQVK